MKLAQKSPYPDTPELDKMKSITQFSQKCGEFLDWLESEKKVDLGKRHVHDASCVGWDEARQKYNPSGNDRCQFWQNEFQPLHASREKLLAEFFGIDLDKVEVERRKILDWMRAHAA